MDVYLMYLRKSRADEEKEALGQHETLSLHRERLGRFCREHGYVVEEVFEELVSGESVAARVEFQRLMTKVQTKRYAGVIVHALDRLGRGDMMEYGWILSTLQYTGTVIVTPERTYDPCDRADLQILQLQMFFANDELSRIKKRLMEGKEGHSERGEHIASRAPLGYRKAVTPDGRKTLEPDEWAPTVAQVFRDVAAGEKLWTLSCRLREQGVPGSWHNQRIKTMIQNPVYKGVIAWNRVVTVVESREGMEYRKKRAKGGNVIEVPGLHPGIVSDELWAAANARIGNNPRGPHGPLRNPLAGLLRCGKCGRAMICAGGDPRKCGKRYMYYRHPYNTDCSAKGAPVRQIIEAVASELAAYASPDALLQVSADETAALDLERSNLERVVAECGRRRQKLMDLYLADGIGVAEYRERRESEEARAAAASARLDQIASESPRDAEAVAVNVRSAMAALAGADAETANRLLKSIVARIDYRFDEMPTIRVVLREKQESTDV